jgi:hypothetical protein
MMKNIIILTGLLIMGAVKAQAYQYRKLYQNKNLS